MLHIVLNFATFPKYSARAPLNPRAPPPIPPNKQAIVYSVFISQSPILNIFLEFGKPTFDERRMLMPDEKNESISNDELDVEATMDLNDSFTDVTIVTDGEFLEDGDVELTDKEEYVDEP
jgi:hypothetical protein